MAKDAKQPRFSRAPTVRPNPAPVVVLIAAPPPLAEAVERVVDAESAGIALEHCGLADVANVVSALRPFAMVISQGMFDFDPQEFEALARDVNAMLVKVKVERMQRTFLEQALRPSLRTAFRNWRASNESGPVSR